MVITKYFYYKDRDLKKAKNLILKSQKYFIVVNAKVVLGDVV